MSGFGVIGFGGAGRGMGDVVGLGMDEVPDFALNAKVDLGWKPPGSLQGNWSQGIS